MESQLKPKGRKLRPKVVMIHVYNCHYAELWRLPLLCQILSGPWAGVRDTNILVGMLSKVIDHMLDASPSHRVNKKNQQCFFGCVLFLMMLIQHYWSVYWSVWLQRKYLVHQPLTSHLRCLSYPPLPYQVGSLIIITRQVLLPCTSVSQ